MNSLIKNPFDFLMLYLYTKKDGEYITTLMKIYQIFTSFERFQHLDHFKASYYGAEDTQLETAIYSASQYFPIEFTGEDDKNKIIRLADTIRSELNSKIQQILSDNEKSEMDYELIEKLSILSKNYSQLEIIKFCYHFWPEKIEKSTIIENISKINDNILRNIVRYFLKNTPIQDSFEFIRFNYQKILELSLLSQKNKEKLERIIITLIKENSASKILNLTKNQFTFLIDNTSDLIFKQILRKGVNLLIFNKDLTLKKDFLIFWIVYLFKLKIEYENEDYNQFINLLDDYNLEYSFNTVPID